MGSRSGFGREPVRYFLDLDGTVVVGTPDGLRVCLGGIARRIDREA